MTERDLDDATDDLDDEEREALEQSIEKGFEDFGRGDTEDAFEVLERLKRRKPPA